jgi:hypothetical protein
MKGRLQFEQITPIAGSIDGFYFLPVSLHGQYQTAAYDIAIETHSASTADPVFTTEAGGFQAKLIPNEISQVHARLDPPGVIDTIDTDGYFG